MADDQGRPVSDEAFALLGHEIRLDILRAFFDTYTPIDPDSRPTARDQRTLSYAELMAATDMEDSGKFNYHLEKLRGAYVAKVENGYIPTASAIALYEAMIANRPTESVSVDFDIDALCPNCESGLRGQSEQEFFTVDCPECDLFWGVTYRFPKNGFAVRDGEDVYEALYDRMMYHVGLARTGQCPSCAGCTSVTVPRERLNDESTHILPVVEELATEIGILYNGQLVTEGSPTDLKTRVETGDESSLEDVFLEVTTDETYAADGSNDG